MRNGHINTVYSTLFRKQAQPLYNRKRLTTHDGDFLDVDLLQNGQNRLAILCHGLEGSSLSSYIIGTGGLLAESNWDVAAINYRGCSGEINNALRMYHSGATDDLQTVIDSLIDEYDEVALIGFSLGGNICLKYAGEQSTQLDTRIKKVVAVSVPVDLKAGSINIGKKSNFIYEKKFIVSLSEKIKLKHQQYPEQVDVGLLKSIKKLYDFDDVYTGPIHGFGGAENYYATCASKQFLKHIERDTLIVNALDDPFLPEECYPFKEVDKNDYIKMLAPKYGGHVGFVKPKGKYYWIERTISRWLTNA